jgi:hypothetical protein
VPAGYTIGRNCIVFDSVVDGDYPQPELRSGETLKPKRKPIRIKV